MLRASLAVLAIAISSPALADANVYEGSIGDIPVVVEFSSEIEDASEPFVGRYFYRTKGIDIPLNAVTVTLGKVELMEELPCTSIELCEGPYETGVLPDALKGATWHLETNDDGAIVTGTWQNGAKGKQLRVHLTWVGSRVLEDVIEPLKPESLLSSSYQFDYGTGVVTMDNAPYDFLKMQVPLTEEPETRWGNVGFRYVVDPRTKFHFPRITKLGGADPAAANARLAGRHALINMDAFWCEAQAYLGLGWNRMISYSLGTFAGLPDEQVNVIYLSPNVMSWVESGSTDCGGAYPNNHYDYTNIDVRTGQNLDLSKIFADSVQGEYSWEPGQSLIDFARAKRVKTEFPDYEEQCGFDELIAEYLSVTFRGDDHVVFTLQGLPHVIMACGEDVYEAPIAELRHLLAPTAAEYFPSLKGQ